MPGGDVEVLELANDENDDWLKKADPEQRKVQLEAYRKIREEREVGKKSK